MDLCIIAECRQIRNTLSQSKSLPLFARFRMVHVICGDGLASLWAQLSPKKVIDVRLSGTPVKKLYGYWVDPANIPRF